MKQLTAVAFLTVLMIGAAIAAPPPASKLVFTEEKLDLIEQNLAIALTSDCPGMEASAALTMRQVKELAPEYEFESLIIPLMHLVKDESASDASRISAALALYDLKSERGDYAISQSARFTENPRVKKMFELLAYQRQVEKRAK